MAPHVYWSAFWDSLWIPALSFAAWTALWYAVDRKWQRVLADRARRR
jgi:hypothetical protein